MAEKENTVSLQNQKLQQQSQELQQKNQEVQNLRSVADQQKEELEKSKDKISELNKNFEKEISGGEVGVTTSGGRIVISLFDAVTFDSGSDVIKPRGKVILNKIINALKDYPGSKIFIEGHTDNVPIRKSKKFRDNWELSTHRALSVLYYILSRNELEPGVFSVAGFGEFEPAKDNDTPENRALNRRVNIAITPKKKPTSDEYK